ncbi:MAG: hypothetical protein PHR81_00890 [Bacteroidales bacterium]|jgi:DNA polymerase-3 subunit delta'|nr:hypothetical protein [Bacteroidales bacterium]MDD4213345.1 hypothetical protein [Bacteroidales bacterium]
MKFIEITGQLQIKNYLVKTVKNSRVSHAQLFLGSEGSGKLALAIAYAQFICCTNKQYFENKDDLQGDSCGICPSCVKFKKLIHPDIHFFFPVTTSDEVKSKPKSENYIKQWRNFLIDNDYYVSLNDWYDTIDVKNKQGIINADDCDEMIKKISLKAYESEYKIVIIWMAEKLYHAAAPKILKILEEPPQKTLFILVSEKHEQILKTILSRTQLVKIPRLKAKEISQFLVQKYQANEVQARKIANISDGNILYAKTLFADDEEEKDNMINLRNWLRICYRFNKEDVLELNHFIDDISKIGREKQKSFFAYALKIIRSSSLQNHGNEKLLNLLDEEKEFIEKFAKVLTTDKIPYVAEEFNKAIYYIERNANPKILFMNLTFLLNQIMRS